MKGNLFGNGQCRAPPLVTGRRLQRDFSSRLIAPCLETPPNDCWVRLSVRAPDGRRRNLTEDYIAHRRPPFTAPRPARTYLVQLSARRINFKRDSNAISCLLERRDYLLKYVSPRPEAFEGGATACRTPGCFSRRLRTGPRKLARGNFVAAATSTVFVKWARLVLITDDRPFAILTPGCEK